MIEIKTLHNDDSGMMAFYAKGDHGLHEFIEALTHYGADDYFEENAPLIECIDWQWWRIVPDRWGEYAFMQYFARRVPAQGAFQVTVFWVNPIDGRMVTRWHLNRDLAGLGMGGRVTL